MYDNEQILSEDSMMDNSNSENNNNQKKESNNNEDINVSKVTIKDFEIEINKNISNANPFELVERLYNLRNEENMTKEEKSNKIQEIIKEYME